MKDIPLTGQFSKRSSYLEYMQDPTPENMARIKKRDDKDYQDWCDAGGGDWVDVDRDLERKYHGLKD
jgi:hypothetical protein